MPSGPRRDPYPNSNFLVEIDGIAVAGFSEVIAPEASVTVIEYREGNEPLTVRKLPGLVGHSNMILKRGVAESTELYEWWRSVESGNIQRRNMSVILLNQRREEVVRWNIREAWPARYQAFSDLNAKGNDVAIETVEIAHEGIERG